MVINKFICNGEIRHINQFDRAMTLIDSVMMQYASDSMNGVDFPLIELECDEITREEFKVLFKKIYEATLPIQLKITTSNSKEDRYNQAFGNIYQKNIRQYHANQMREQANIKKSDGGQISYADLRRAKITMNNTVASNMDLQQQQQQQQRKRYYDPQKRKQYTTSANNNINQDRFKQDEQDENKDFINRNNIIEKLGPFLKSISTSNDTNLLLTIWDNLVGSNIGSNEDRHRITQVEISAMKKIIENYQEFQYGITFEHLPLGFEIKIKQTPNSIDTRLYYNEEQEKAEFFDNARDPLRINIYQQEKGLTLARNNHMLGLYTLNPNNLPSDELADRVYSGYDFGQLEYEELLNQLYNASEENNKHATDVLLNIMEKRKPDTIAKIATLGFKNHFKFKRAFAKILVTEGLEAASLFLEQLIKFQNVRKERYQSFEKLFINNQTDLMQFATKEGQENLNALMEFKDAEFNWWETLVTQHIHSGAHADFNSLFNAFKAFVSKVYKAKRALGEDPLLTPSCPFRGIKNMIVALDRAQFVMGDESNDYRSEQIEHLMRPINEHESPLDLSSEGAYYARKYNHYQIVTKQMNLTQQVNNQSLTLSEIIKSSYEKSLSYDQVKQTYYRFLGQQNDRRFTLDEYIALEEFISNLDKNKQFNLTRGSSADLKMPAMTEKEYQTLKCALLNIVLISLTKLRSTTLQLEAKSELNSLISLIKNILSNGEPERITLLKEHAIPALLRLVEVPNNVKPTLTELVTWCNDLESRDAENATQFLKLIPDALKSFGNSFYQVMNIAHKRMELSTDHESHEIKALNLVSFINILNSHVFKNEQTRLDYAVMLSLVSDSNNIETAHSLAEMMSNPRTSEQMIDEFTNIYKRINLDRTRQLPTTGQVIEVMKACFKACEHTSASSARHEQMSKIITENEAFKNVVFGCQSIEQSKYGVVDVIKAYLLKHNINIGISAIKTTLNKKQRESELPVVGRVVSAKTKQNLKKMNELISILENDVKELVEHLDTETNSANLRPCLEILKKIDKAISIMVTLALESGHENELSEFIDGFVEHGKNSSAMKNKFFTQRSMIVFMSADINEKFAKELNIIFKRLLMDGSLLEAACLHYLGNLQDQGDIIEAIEGYAHKFDNVIKLTNCLTELKNKDDNEFNQLKLTIKQLLAADNQFNFPIDKLSQLLSILIKDKKTPTHVHLENFYKKLIEQPELINNLDTTMNSFEVLIEFQDILPADLFQQLIAASFETNNSSSNASLESVITGSVVSKDQIIELLNVIENQNNHFDKKQSLALLVDVAKVVAALCREDEQSANEFMKTTINTIKLYGKDHPRLVDYMHLILQFAMNHNDFIKQYYASFINSIIKNPGKIDDLLDIILSVTANEALTPNHNITLNHLIELLKILNTFPRGKVNLTKIANLYRFKPYPKLDGLSAVDSLIVLLNSKNNQINEEIKAIDRDPFNGRKNINVAAQFGTDRIVPVISHIRNCLDGETLNQSEALKLGRQCLYINSIGNDYSPDGYAKRLSQLSRAKLLQLAKNDMQEMKILGRKREVLEIEFLAVLREIMFRTTGKLPYTTQLISVLQAVNHNNNLLLQINTGEGKSITSALLSVMQWAKGETVDVCTANMDLASRDYENFKNFFNFLEIPNAKIVADSYDNNYQVGGINYSTVADLSLYRSRAELEGIDLKHINNQKIPTSLILDEVDYNTLDNRTLFNYTLSQDTSDTNDIQNIAWIYPFINDFIDTNQFRNLDVKKGAYSETKDLLELAKYLKEKVKEPNKIKQIAIINDIDKNQLSQWLDAACDARKLVRERDYSIECDEKTNLCIAIPKNANNPQPGSTYRHGVQQFLHARLQKESMNYHENGFEKYHFPIDPELQVAASKSSKTFIDYYKKEGRVIGMSGTLGSLIELLEQKHQLNAKILSIPPHKDIIRNVKFEPKKNAKEIVNAIKDEIAPHHHNIAYQLKLKNEKTPRPTLVVCENSIKAQNMFTEVSGIDYDRWVTAKQIFAGIGQNFDEKMQLATIPYQKYSNAITSLNLLLEVKNTIFKNSKDLQNIITKIINHENLQTMDIRILKSISTNSYYQQKQDDFDDFKKIMDAVDKNTHLPRGSKKCINYLIQGVFKHHPEIVQMLTKINTGIRPNEKELTFLKDAALKPWYYFNTDDYLEYELVVGNEKQGVREEKIAKAKNPYTVTLSTSLLGRGFDRAGLRVIQTYIDSSRNTDQIMGRAFRNGESGEYILFYDTSEIEKSYHMKLDSHHHRANLEKIKQIQANIDENEACERYYIQQVDSASNLVMREFQRFEKFIYQLYANDVKDRLYYKRMDELLAKRVNLIKVMENKWKELLEKSDSDYKYVSNPYIRRDSEGKLEQQNLDQSFLLYESALKEIWYKTKQQLIEDFINDHIKQSEDVQLTHSRLKYLNEISLAENFEKLKQIHELEADKQLLAAEISERKLNYALNADEIYHQYAKDKINDADRFKIITNDLLVALNDVQQLINRANLSTESRKYLTELCNKIDAKKDILVLKGSETDSQKKTKLAGTIQQFYSLLGEYKDYCTQADDQYEAQSLVAHILKASNRIHFDKSSEFSALEDKICRTFMEHASLELVKYIKNNLSWVENQHSLQYKIERSDFCQAAAAILVATKQLEQLPTLESILHLEQLLHQYKIETAKTWSFNSLNPFGHRDIKTVISEACNLAEHLTYIPKLSAEPHDKNQKQYIVLDKKDHLNIKSEAIADLLRNKLLVALESNALIGENANAYHKISQIIKNILNHSTEQHDYQFEDVRYGLQHYLEIYLQDSTRYPGLIDHLTVLIKLIKDDRYKDLNLNYQQPYINQRFIDYKTKQLKNELFTDTIQGEIQQFSLDVVPHGGQTVYQLTLEAAHDNQVYDSLEFKRVNLNHNGSAKDEYFNRNIKDCESKLSNSMTVLQTLNANQKAANSQLDQLNEKLKQAHDLEQSATKANLGTLSDKEDKQKPSIKSRISSWIHQAREYIQPTKLNVNAGTAASNIKVMNQQSALQDTKKIQDDIDALNKTIIENNRKIAAVSQEIDNLKFKKETIANKITDNQMRQASSHSDKFIYHRQFASINELLDFEFKLREQKIDNKIIKIEPGIINKPQDRFSQFSQSMVHLFNRAKVAIEHEIEHEKFRLHKHLKP